MKHLDDIIKIDERIAKKEIISMCVEQGNYDAYDTFFTAVELYQQAGYRIEYFYNADSREYFIETRNKTIGFVK